MHRFTLLALLLPLLCGCGGSGGGHSSTKGKLALTITWPKPGRLIPDAANSIKLSIFAGSDEVASKVVARPAGGSGQTHVVLGELPPMELLLKATAHPEANGTGNSQAAGTVLVSVSSDVTTNTSILMGSTVHHVALTPSVSSVAFHESKSLTATAFDEASAMILTNPARWTWQTSNANLGIDPEGNTCTITGNTLGSASLIVKETESGKSLTKTISISSSSGANGYTITPLCQLGNISYFGGLNDHGDAVGFYWESGINRPYVYRNGVMSLLPLDNFPGFQTGQANGINNDGKIAGTVYDSTMQGVAVWYPDGSHRHVGPAGTSWALGIGEQGQVFGAYRAFWFDPYGPAVWENDDANPNVYGSSSGGISVALNEQGVPALTYYTGVFVGRIETNPPQTLQGTGTSTAVTVKDRSGNRTVGTVGNQIAVWNGVNLTLLGQGNAESVNADGFVVGSNSQGAGFIWSQATGFVDLLGKVSNSTGWVTVNPQAINANGQIAGVGIYNNQTRAFLLTPN